MTRLHKAPALALALGCLAFAGPARADDVREAVEAANRALITAFLAGDASAVSDLYTQDAQVIAPGSPIASGRPAIATFFQGLLDSGAKDLALETTEAQAVGDLAYETGILRLVAKDDSTSESRYVVVWKRIEGRWMLHRDTWNSL